LTASPMKPRNEDLSSVRAPGLKRMSSGAMFSMTTRRRRRISVIVPDRSGSSDAAGTEKKASLGCARDALEVEGRRGALLLGGGHDEIDGVLWEAMHRQVACLVDLLEVDHDAAQPVHQGVLQQAGEDAKAVVLAHQDVR